jgi:hypothetical protein
MDTLGTSTVVGGPGRAVRGDTLDRPYHAGTTTPTDRRKMQRDGQPVNRSVFTARPMYDGGTK